MTNFNDVFRELDGLDNSEIYIKAPIPYPGSKFENLDKILPHLPPSNVYVEPFGGSGAVLLNKKPCKVEVFNDRNAGLIALYRCLRDPAKLEALIARLELTLWSREEFLWCKATWFEDQLDDVERAARWYYKIQFSFSSKGTAFGRTVFSTVNLKNQMLGRLKGWPDIHKRFCSVLIENNDWEKIILDYDSPNTVFYLDPPYLTEKIYQHHMSEEDHKRMVQLIFKCKGFVALSGYANPIYDSPDLHWDERHTWPVKTKFAQGQPNTDLKTRTQRTEVLWIKYES